MDDGAAIPRGGSGDLAWTRVLDNVMAVVRYGGHTPLHSRGEWTC